MSGETCADGVLGVVLAGGRSCRMGRDKAMLRLGGETFMQRAVRRLTGRLGAVVISAAEGRDYAGAGVPLVADLPQLRGLGPLAGIASGMAYAQKNGFNNIITVAVDTPFFPDDYVERLCKRYDENNGRPVIATAKEEYHPTFALWPLNLGDSLRRILQGDGRKSILAFAESQQADRIDFVPQPPDFIDPFFNINTPEDFSLAQTLYRNHEETLP